MKVKSDKTFFYKNRRVNPGDVIDMNDDDAERLIKINYVKEDKLSNRKTKEEK